MQSLIPSSQERLISMQPRIVAQLLQKLPQLAERLVQVKLAFPTCAASKLFASQPALALSERSLPFQQAADRLHELLPKLNVDRCAWR